MRALGNGRPGCEPRSGDRDFVTLAMLITGEPCRPFGVEHLLAAVTQGSQSLTLSLTLTAAPQLVEWC